MEYQIQQLLYVHVRQATFTTKLRFRSLSKSKLVSFIMNELSSKMKSIPMCEQYAGEEFRVISRL